MRRIIYYVAVSLDGYIAGKNDDISGFVQEGPGVSQYLQDLQYFDTVIMGRRTYEFGYKFGLKPGQPAYPHMRHYIFSETLSFEKPADTVEVCPPDIHIIHQLKAQPGSDIYLCGGASFAGWLLDQRMIDILKIKLNPLILGSGTPLFGKVTSPLSASVVHSKAYEDGLQIIEYELRY